MIQRLIAVTPAGLEQLVAREIRSLGGGIGRTRVDRDRVEFEGPPDALMRANLHLRAAARILVPLARAEVRDFGELRRVVADIPWEDYLPPGLEVRFSVSALSCRLYHSGAVQDAIREGLLARRLKLPDGDGRNWATIDARGTNDMWTLCIDSSGPGLWRRGYRQRTAKAPLRENLAAALLLASGWRGERPLLDPMCGSGTFVIEAARIAQGRAPGLDRRFAFERFPCLDQERWAELKQQAVERVDPSGGGARIEGADAVAGAIRAARDNSRRADTVLVRFERRRIEETPKADGPGLVIFNPPYGHRTGDEQAVDQWRAWRAALLDRRPGWDVVVVTPGQEMAEALGAKGRPLARFRNGGIRVRAVRL